jgi:hypothetical protein
MSTWTARRAADNHVLEQIASFRQIGTRPGGRLPGRRGIGARLNIQFRMRLPGCRFPIPKKLLTTPKSFTKIIVILIMICPPAGMGYRLLPDLS